ncbi:hypothetical protein AB7281_21540, partial [Providencia rettgeri]
TSRSSNAVNPSPWKNSGRIQIRIALITGVFYLGSQHMFVCYIPSLATFRRGDHKIHINCRLI